MYRFDSNDWALVLGGSSGFGLATAKKLARHGMSVVVVHRDLRGMMARVEKDFDEIRRTGARFVALNLNALEEAGRNRTLESLRENLGAKGRVKLLLHSIAQGNLKRVASDPGAEEPELTDEDFAGTIYAMGTSLLSWVRAVHRARLFAPDARVLSLTSEGSRKALPVYAAVSAAKAVLEALSRSIATELAPYGIRCNVIQAGVTDTAALQRIPGNETMKDFARVRNPFKRLTTPEDVADFIFLMAMPEAAWVNGAVLAVDGGESITLPSGGDSGSLTASFGGRGPA